MVTEGLKKESRPHNTGFASGGVIPPGRDRLCKLGALCFYSSSVLADSEVLPPKESLREKPARTQSPKTLNSKTLFIFALERLDKKLGSWQSYKPLLLI